MGQRVSVHGGHGVVLLLTGLRATGSGGNPYNAGLFHSGAAFGDDEFFGLYRRVAQAILKTIPGAHRDEEPEAELDVVSIQPGSRERRR